MSIYFEEWSPNRSETVIRLPWCGRCGRFAPAVELSMPSGAEWPILGVGRMGSWRGVTVKIFAQEFRLDGFFLVVPGTMDGTFLWGDLCCEFVHRLTHKQQFLP